MCNIRLRQPRCIEPPYARLPQLLAVHLPPLAASRLVLQPSRLANFPSSQAILSHLAYFLPFSPISVSFDWVFGIPIIDVGLNWLDLIGS